MCSVFVSYSTNYPGCLMKMPFWRSLPTWLPTYRNRLGPIFRGICLPQSPWQNVWTFCTLVCGKMVEAMVEPNRGDSRVDWQGERRGWFTLWRWRKRAHLKSHSSREKDKSNKKLGKGNAGKKKVKSFVKCYNCGSNHFLCNCKKWQEAQKKLKNSGKE